MRKIISCIVIAALVATTYIPSYATTNIEIEIDNQIVQFTEASGSPFIDQSNRTQVPFRQTMEQFGCTISWDPETKTAIAEKGDTVVKVPIGASYIIKDGQNVMNDTAALIKDNRTYLPIRAVLEAFGASVGWDSSTQTVVVLTNPNTEVITEKDKMLEAFALVNKAIPQINQINSGRITSEFSGFFMLAGKEVKEETTIEKTLEGLSNKTTVTYFDGTTELYEAVSDRTVSDIVYLQWYPKEEIKKEYFDTAEKLTINQNKDSTEFRIDWKQDEIKASPNIYLQYLYSHITVDKNGYITDWSFYAKSYEKDAEGAKINVTDSTATVKLSDYSD